MTDIKDLIEKTKTLPDGRTLLLFDHNPSCTIKTDDLKALVSELERKTRALERIAKCGSRDGLSDIAQAALEGKE